jgi:hypothetical protein
MQKEIEMTEEPTAPPDYCWELVNKDEIKQAEQLQIANIERIIRDILESYGENGVLSDINIDLHYKHIHISVTRCTKMGMVTGYIKSLPAKIAQLTLSYPVKALGFVTFIRYYL